MTPEQAERIIGLLKSINVMMGVIAGLILGGTIGVIWGLGA